MHCTHVGHCGQKAINGAQVCPPPPEKMLGSMWQQGLFGTDARNTMGRGRRGQVDTAIAFSSDQFLQGKQPRSETCVASRNPEILVRVTD